MSRFAGEIIGVFLLSGSPNEESETMLTVNFAPRPSPRWLEETKGIPDSIKIAEVLLVRRTLAWITGIILIISTLLGVSFLYLIKYLHTFFPPIVLFIFKRLYRGGNMGRAGPVGWVMGQNGFGLKIDTF